MLYKTMRRATFIAILLGVLLFSCKNMQSDRELLREAEVLSDSIPTQALAKLKAIESGARFSDAEKAKYGMLLTKARLKNYNRTHSDSLINQSIDYYRAQKDSIRLFDALYLKGLTHYRLGNHKAALECFMEAGKILPQTQSVKKKISALQLSGFCNLYLGDTKAAVENQEKAVDFSTECDTATQIRSLHNLGETYKYDMQPNKALEIYLGALQLARQSDKIELQEAALNRLADFYVEQNDYRKALDFKKQAHALRINRKDIPAQNLAQAILFNKLNQPDSSRYYLTLAIKGSDIVVADIAYGYLCEWYLNKEIFDDAYNAWQNKENTHEYYKTNIETKSLQHEYEKEKLKNENNELKIKQKEKDILLISILFAVFILSVVAYIFWVQNKRKRDHERFVLKERQLNSENLLLKKEKEISHLREKEALLRESLLRHISFSNKIPSLSAQENEDDAPNRHFLKIEMSEADWKHLKQSVNEAYPNFTEHLKEKFPKLTEEDILFCCLLKINVNMQDLSDIYCVSKAAITKRKYRIKTSKLNLNDNTIDLDTFLREFY